MEVLPSLEALEIFLTILLGINHTSKYKKKFVNDNEIGIINCVLGKFALEPLDQ
jgi:hypothetical protein